MYRRLQTVKTQISVIVVMYALIATVLVLAFSLILLNTFHRRRTLQAVEFNLQLVCSVVGQDIQDMTALAKWCGNGGVIADLYTADARTDSLIVRTHDRMLEEYSNTRAKNYIWRLLIVDEQRTTILQAGGFSTRAPANEPVTIYNVDRLTELSAQLPLEWENLSPDPFSASKALSLIPYVCPLRATRDMNQIGVVYLAATTDVVTDKLAGYPLPENSRLYLSLGGNSYYIGNDNTMSQSVGYEVLDDNVPGAVSDHTEVRQVREPNGSVFLSVTCPVRPGMTLTHMLPNELFLPPGQEWFSLVAGLMALIFLLSVLTFLLLDRRVSRPVARLRRRIERIAGGDFTQDKSLESNSELGQMGKSLNQLSRDVAAHMDSRLADEKNKQELEYRMLQNQINPHFLYNTLNSIRWMATIQHADGIAEMTAALSRLLRTVAKDIRKTVPLSEELALLDDYMILQNYRYGGTLSLTKWHEEERLLDTPIPRFTLQPLVENAIFHGLEPLGGGAVAIRTVRDGSDAVITVDDDGVGMSPETIRGIYEDDPSKTGMFKGIGIRNVEERLKHAFGPGYGLSIRSEEGRYTTMIIRLPCCPDIEPPVNNPASNPANNPASNPANNLEGGAS